MAVAPVTPQAPLASVVTTGGTAVTVFPAGISGGFIQNPASAADQGLGGTEPLYVNVVNAADVAGNGTTFALAPGQTWTAIPGQTTVTSCNAASSGHKFAASFWI
jgi:hypothetical protein